MRVICKDCGKKNRMARISFHKISLELIEKYDFYLCRDCRVKVYWDAIRERAKAEK
ncbi:hypothetical protein LCGC14_1482470 [marine sediment metagenome]|uniref:Uncharacterized protein n=1 Tax=marine sediment metagenome TaxID=412755 RepID=A0A0F9JV49_9ZZZZ